MLRLRPVVVPLCLVLTLLTVGTVAVPGRAQDQPVELLVWDQFTNPAQSEVVDALYQAFEEANPNITIDREVFQTQQMQQTVNTALASGTGPDIIFYDAGPGFAGVLIEAGLLMSLEEPAAEYGWREQIAETAIRGASLNDELYGLPLQTDLIGMYANTTLIEQEGLQVPGTVEELLTFCQEAAAAGYIPVSFGDNPGWQAGHQFSMVSTNMVGPEYMEQLLFEQEGSWNTPEMVTAIDTYFVDMREAGCFSPDVNALTGEDADALFFSGQSLLYPTGSWAVSNIETNMPDFMVEYMPFPALPGGEGRFWVTGVGSAFFISTASEHQAEAAQLLDYLFSAEAAARWVQDARFVVPVEFDSSGLDISPLFRSIVEVLSSAAGGEIVLGYNIDVLAPPEFNEMMTNGFQAMLAGDKTAEQQAADLQAAWEAALADE